MEDRVLFVDDETSVLDSFRAVLRRKYNMVTLDSPVEALSFLKQKGPVAVVVSDLKMVEMDGITFLSKVRELYPDTVRMMLTGHGGYDEAMAAVNKGHIYRFMSKPVDRNTLISNIDAALEAHSLSEELKLSRMMIEEDLRTAAFVQKAFLPNRPLHLNNVLADWVFEPCELLGGDMLDVFDIGEGQVGFYILDMSGHGAASALVAVAVTELVRSLMKECNNDCLLNSPSDMLNYLDSYYPIERFEKHFTIFYGVIDTEKQQISYSNGGHWPALLIRNDDSIEELNEGGTIIGLSGAVPFESGTVDYNEGDRLLLYTDGIIEHRSPKGPMFGQDRVIDFVQKSSRCDINEVARALYEEVLRFGDGKAPNDDMTILSLTLGNV